MDRSQAILVVWMDGGMKSGLVHAMAAYANVEKFSHVLRFGQLQLRRLVTDAHRREAALQRGV